MKVDVNSSYAITSLYHWDQYWVRYLNVALRVMSYGCQHYFDASGVFGTSEDVTCVDRTSAWAVGSIIINVRVWWLVDVVRR